MKCLMWFDVCCTLVSDNTLQRSLAVNCQLPSIFVVLALDLEIVHCFNWNYLFLSLKRFPRIIPLLLEHLKESYTLWISFNLDLELSFSFYCLTQCGRVRLENWKVSQPSKKSFLLWNRKMYHCISCHEVNKSISPILFLFLTCTLILSSHIYLSLLNGVFLLNFSIKNVCTFLISQVRATCLILGPWFVYSQIYFLLL